MKQMISFCELLCAEVSFSNVVKERWEMMAKLEKARESWKIESVRTKQNQPESSKINRIIQD